jgi:hypothetical protein
LANPTKLKCVVYPLKSVKLKKMEAPIGTRKRATKMKTTGVSNDCAAATSRTLRKWAVLAPLGSGPGAGKRPAGAVSEDPPASVDPGEGCRGAPAVRGVGEAIGS